MSDYHELFEYSDGKLYWAHSRGRVKSGTRAGTKHSRGYRKVTIDKKKLFEHRVVWEMHNGPIPEGLVIDHINCNPRDNRIENLRCVTQADNVKNSDFYRAYLEVRSNG